MHVHVLMCYFWNGFISFEFYDLNHGWHYHTLGFLIWWELVRSCPADWDQSSRLFDRKNYKIISTSNCRREPDFDNNVTKIQNKAAQCYTEPFTYQNEKASVLVICIWITSKYLISCPNPIWNDLIPFPRCRPDHDFSIDLLRHTSRKKEVHL